MRIGFIAPEFPPRLGGMAELARGLGTALAETNEVRVHTFPGQGVTGGVLMNGSYKRPSLVSLEFL